VTGAIEGVRPPSHRRPYVSKTREDARHDSTRRAVIGQTASGDARSALHQRRTGEIEAGRRHGTAAAAAPGDSVANSVPACGFVGM